MLATDAAGLGFDGLLYSDTVPLHDVDQGTIAEFTALCAKAGLNPVVQLDIARFPLNHPAVVANPELFAFRSNDARSGVVDPRNPLPAAGQAVARVRSSDAAAVIGKVVAQSLIALVEGSGIATVQIAGADQMHPELLGSIVTAVRASKPDTGFLAAIDRDPTHAGTLGGTGVDCLVAPLATLNASSSGGLPTLAVVGSAGAPRTPYALAEAKSAAALGHGVVAPLDWLSGPEGIEALEDAITLLRQSSEYAGEWHPLAAAGSAVEVMLRSRAGDLRSSADALLILRNTTDTERGVPQRSALSDRLGSFGDVENLAPLAPYEVRLVPVERGNAIVTVPDAATPMAAGGEDRLVIEAIAPCVDNGAHAVKRTVGETVEVRATIFADGHEKLSAELFWRAADEPVWHSARMLQQPNDLWLARFDLRRLGRHEYRIEAWLDRFAGFQRDFAKKVAAGVALPVDQAEGLALIETAAKRSHGALADGLIDVAQMIANADAEAAGELLLSSDLRVLMDKADDRPHRAASPTVIVDAERIEARFSSWYEIFPRSMTDNPERHGTFDDVIDHLPRIRAMGFDTLYFPPIHPIGTANRKGPNNTLTPGPGDPGSPYAIGSADGGHDAIHPELGTFADFDRLVRVAADHGLEIALDFAIQASPDHPWLQEHPGWFAWLPDGSMKYAENPPKKYQDIVNFDFYGPDAQPGLWHALRDVILLWVRHGVKTFRVDNPHTKPLPFWEWMIAEVRAQHPEVLFLSEAFTRPNMMYRLAKVGFNQSYTYFTWRDTKAELVDYITELATEAPKDFYRPHFFVNTPDINPHFLQTGGRPAHRIRAVLAATLSGLWGVYSGFELCDAAPLGPGKEEYLDSEKYQIRVRDWNEPGNIIADVTRLNALRRTHPALQTHLNTRFYTAHDDNIIWYGKPSPTGGTAQDGALSEMIMVMVNMDPHHSHGCAFEIPLWEFGLPDHASIAVEDLVEGHRFDWHGKTQHIELHPSEPYRIWRLSLPEENA
ncbi:alpha-1,4-glucan--maltose-1-phosphate maltosyltransferase [Blastomonas sp.]|uniref:alpha-1,4-glucan--maltose-1-phosphate maltosyltransferase n=1 Tax=Blastomonas sp. TaxID=1909299 RepID=UPI00391BA9B8